MQTMGRKKQNTDNMFVEHFFIFKLHFLWKKKTKHRKSVWN
jgi:hypothetical protein